MKQALSQRSYFIVLLPTFFVLHGYAANARYMEFGNILPLLATLIVASVLLFFFFKWLLKTACKAGLMTLYAMGYFLFFGALYDFLKAWSPWKFLWKYSVLLSIFLLAGLLLFFMLRRTRKDLSRTIFFFNLLFLVFICTDLVKLTGYFLGNKNRNGHTPIAAGTLAIPPDIPKPDIYLLLFDEYSSTNILKTKYNFDNSDLDSFLVGQGFHLNSFSKSNYPETSFSMASCLNMDYLHWLKPGMPITREHYQRCSEEIRNNAVVQALRSNGYQVVNQSIFDLKHYPAPVSQRWFSIDTRLITEETMLARLCYEFYWFFNRFALLRKILPVTSYEEQLQNNDRCLAGVMEAAAGKTGSPRFIYGHFLLPHFPYFKNRNGQLLPDSLLKGMFEGKVEPLPHYLEYVQYANGEIKQLITHIRAKDPGAVIIFMSDHGYRWKVPESAISNVFYNQNAVYLPSGKYEQFHGSISNVNQFRILFNSLFDQRYQLLPDSCILTGKAKSHIEQIEQYEK